MRDLITKINTFFQKISHQYRCYKKGIPAHLLRLFRTRKGLVDSGKLQRRSKIHSIEKHWDETRLGEISCNWDNLCKNPKYVLLNPLSEETLFSTKHKRVIIANLDRYDGELPENYPFSKVLDDSNENSLRVEIIHAPLDENYSHCNISCYLTTKDGEYTNSLVPHDGYNTHPLKKKLRGLRNKYKAHLIYHFQNDYIDFE